MVGTGPCAPKFEAVGSDLICPSELVVGKVDEGEVAGVGGDI